MTKLKKVYSSKFDLKSVANSEEADVLFAGYKNEFIDKKPDINTFISLSLNMINDFLQNKFDEKTIGLLVHRLLIDKCTKEFFAEPYLWDYNDVLALLHEFLDLDWAKESPNYPDHLESLKSKFSELVEKYSV